MAKNETGYAEISKSRSKKNPFKVKIVGKNGEPLVSAELLTTLRNCTKNLLATMKVFNGKCILVSDLTGKEKRCYTLHSDGLEAVFN